MTFFRVTVLLMFRRMLTIDPGVDRSNLSFQDCPHRIVMIPTDKRNIIGSRRCFGIIYRNCDIWSGACRKSCDLAQNVNLSTSLMFTPDPLSCLDLSDMGHCGTDTFVPLQGLLMRLTESVLTLLFPLCQNCGHHPTLTRKPFSNVFSQFLFSRHLLDKTNLCVLWP